MVPTLRCCNHVFIKYRNVLSVKAQTLLLAAVCLVTMGSATEEKPAGSGTASISAMPPYCTPSFGWDMEPICNVTFNTINNNSSCTVNSGPFYSNYSAISTTVNPLSTYPISVSGNTAGPYTAYINVFIDFNQNDSFNDAGEQFQLGTIYNCTNCAVTGNITIPGTATLGTTTMRVMKRFNAYATPCNTDGWGEAEDYTINIQSAGPPLLLTASSTTICSGQSATVSITPGTVGNYDQYTWSPAGGTGTAPDYTFSPTSTTTYTLTGYNTVTSQTNIATYTVNVNAAPSAVSVTPSNPSVCPGDIVSLVATGGAVSGETAFSENFNDTPVGWTTQNNGSGGTVANGAWYLYDDGDYVFFETIHSNDNSGFAAVDSDWQGYGSTTISNLTSPQFSLVGYNSASLSFWHYYKNYIGGESCRVQVSVNNGAFTTVQTWTNNVGNPANFVNTIINLTPYVGNANVRLRFLYTASWGFGWAIDNVVVTGNAPAAITWSPATGLFTNAAATTPYTGAAATTVYAMPASTTTYTATATNALTGCTSATPVTVTIPVVAGTIADDQTVCAGVADDILLTGHTGSVVTWQSAPDPSFTTGVVNIPGSAGAATLTSAMLGNVTATTYIRAVILGGSCTAYTNTVTLTVISAVWDGSAWNPAPPTAATKAIFDGDYSSTGDIEACSVLVLSGDVVFNSGHNLIVENEVVVDNILITAGKSLTFENDASLVQVNDNALNAGTIIYKRNTAPMIQYDYTYWSSPVFPQTLAALSPLTLSDKYYWWNPTLYDWETIAVPGISVMTPGQGYIIRAPQGYTATPQVFPGTFNGVPNNGEITIGITVNGANDYNLLGNPYPSAIDADVMLAATGPNASVLGGTVYLWTHNTPITSYQYVATDYAMYNLTGGTGTGTAGGGTGNSNVPDGKIAAGQGFFIKGQSTGIATFNNSMRVMGNNSMFFRSVSEDLASGPTELEKHRIWLELTSALGAYKQILVGYIETATNEIDHRFDGDVFETGNTISFYSLAEEHTLGIQGRALPFDISDVVPLGFRSDIAGVFEIGLGNFDGLFVSEDTGIYLEDKLLNIVHNLKSGAYQFATEAGTFNDRFVLRYTDESLQIHSPNKGNFIVHRNDAGIHVYSPQHAISMVRIYDLRGRLLLNANGMDRNSITISDLHAASQVMIVQVLTSDGLIYHRKIIF